MNASPPVCTSVWLMVCLSPALAASALYPPLPFGHVWHRWRIVQKKQPEPEIKFHSLPKVREDE